MLRGYIRLLLTSLALIQVPAVYADFTGVQAVQYPAWLERDDQRVPLAPGDALKSGDTVVSGADSRIVVGLSDGAQVRLGNDSRFVIDKLDARADDGVQQVDGRFTLLVGVFRYSTGVLGKLRGERTIELSLRSVVIGIRGTDYWAMTDEEHDAVCLFDGKVELTTRDQGVINLDLPTAFWARFFDKPAEPAGNATPAQLAKFVASVEPVPGNGMAIVGGNWRVLAAAADSAGAARELTGRLRAAGYPALIVKRNGRHEVRVNHFATRRDAEAALKRMGAQPGLTGPGAGIAEAR